LNVLQVLGSHGRSLTAACLWLVSIHIVTNYDGRPTGQAFVEFASPVDASAAMAKDRQSMGTRYVELFPSSREEVARSSGGY
jgi:RNA recognition motif. (a.k.a. RRM, RBD, or RNP domain)